MPELPEVETVRRIFDRVLTGRKLSEVEVAPDEIVLQGVPSEVVAAHLGGRIVTGTGRKGKYWWIELDEKPMLFGHLGMAGWVREIGADTIRLREHGQAPLDEPSGRPKFLKLRLRTDEGREAVMTDGRRLARLWLGASPEEDPRVSALGPDSWTELPAADDLHRMLVKRKAPLKAILLDQKVFAGVGNWIADEAMYHASLAPGRLGTSLSLPEVEVLREKLWQIVDLAVSVGANSEQFPESWMFHHRWGGGKGVDLIEGEAIRRDTIGGRTTAWVPTRQK